MSAAVLITGATGFLGHALIAALLKRGETVIACGRDGGKLEHLRTKGAHILQGDLSEAHGLARFQPPAPVKAVIHAAALSSPWGTRAAFAAANIAATDNLVRAAREWGVKRFVFISSSSVYFAFRDQLQIDEEFLLPPPVNDYAFSKREAEKTVLAAPDIGPVVLRPRGIYGHGDTALLPRLLSAAARGPLPLLRGGAAVTDLTHVDDVTAASLAALDADREAEGRIFNVAGGDPQPVAGVVEKACRLAGAPQPRWRTMPVAPLMAAVGLVETAHALWPGRPEPRVTRYSLGLLAYSQTLDIARAAAMLNWRPAISFEDGLRRTFDA